jgi:hypothetical protein
VKKLPDDAVEEPSGGYEAFYPIITIYLLGYSLPDLPYMAVTVDRDVINSVSKEKVTAKSFFIEHLTHKAHIIQIGRLPEKRKTKLERLISLFDQQYRSGNDFILDLPVIPEGFTAMVHYLQQPLLDEQFQRALEYEEEVDYWAWEMDNKYQKIIERAEKKTLTAEKKTKAALKKINTLQNQSVEAFRLQEEAYQQKINLARKLAAIMKKQGIATEIIQAETGLTASEIENCEN